MPKYHNTHSRPNAGNRGRRRYERTVDPTPEEIAAECLRIQKGWSRAEQKRRAGEPERYTLPVVAEREVFG